MGLTWKKSKRLEFYFWLYIFLFKSIILIKK